MTDRERWRYLATADDATLEQVDRVLMGERLTPANGEQSLALLTLTETAKRLNVSRVTIYRMLQRGTLKSVPLNGVHRIKMQSVLDYLDGRAA